MCKLVCVYVSLCVGVCVCAWVLSSQTCQLKMIKATANGSFDNKQSSTRFPCSAFDSGEGTKQKAGTGAMATDLKQ